MAKNKQGRTVIAVANSLKVVNLEQIKSETRESYVFLAARLCRNPKSLSREAGFGKKRAFATAIIERAPRFYVEIF